MAGPTRLFNWRVFVSFVMRGFLFFSGSSGFFFLVGGLPSKGDSFYSLDSFEPSSSPEFCFPIANGSRLWSTRPNLRNPWSLRRLGLQVTPLGFSNNRAKCWCVQSNAGAAFIGVALWRVTCCWAFPAHLWSRSSSRLSHLWAIILLWRTSLSPYNPYQWRLPRPNGSWFEIHYRNWEIPSNYFKCQLRMNRDTFDLLLNLLHPFLLRHKHLVAWLYSSRDSAYRVESFVWPLH